MHLFTGRGCFQSCLLIGKKYQLQEKNQNRSQSLKRVFCLSRGICTEGTINSSQVCTQGRFKALLV